MKLQPHSNTCQASSGEACICGAGQLNYVILLQDRNEKLERLLVASKALNIVFCNGLSTSRAFDDWRKAMADLEQP